jgi:tetratricopeptide (TPR) repeat protein
VGAFTQHELDRLFCACLRNLKIKVATDVYIDPAVERALEKARRKQGDSQNVMDAGVILAIRNYHADEFVLDVFDIPGAYDQPERTEKLYLAIRAGANELQGEVDAAIADYTKLLELDGDSTWALACRGRLLVDKSDFAAARNDLEKRAALETIPQNKPLAQAALDRLKALENCEDVLEVEFSAVPTEARQHYLHARHTTSKAGDNKRELLRALAILDTAIQAAGEKFPRAHTLKAMIFTKLGNYEKAEEEANQALDESPHEFDSLYLLAAMAVAACPTEPNAPEQGFVGDIARSSGSGFISRVFSTGSDEYQKQKAINEWKSTVREHFAYVEGMVALFRELCDHGINAENYISFSQSMLDVQDSIEEMGLPFPPHTIPQTIVDIPDNRLFWGKEDEHAAVENVRQVAWGYLQN